MDIRSWLQGPKGIKKVQKTPEVKKKKPSKMLESDSDDDSILTVKSKTGKSIQKENQPVKEVDPASFFASSKKVKKSSQTPRENSIAQNVEKTKKRKFSSSPEKPTELISSKRAKTDQEKEKLVKKSSKSKKLSEKMDTSESPEKPKKPKKEKSEPKSEAETTLVADNTVEPEAEKPAKKFNYFAHKAKIDAGPRNPGSKEIPKGAENCLEGLTFVITGIGESLGRDETKSLIERYGGKVTSAVSGKTAFLLVGDEPGESKIRKAKEKNVEQIDEDRLLDLIRSKPGKRSKYEIEAEKEFEAEKAKKTQKEVKKLEKLSSSPKKFKKERTEKSPEKSPKIKKPSKLSKTASNESVGASKVEKMKIETTEKLMPEKTPPSMWVEKYKPQEFKKIVGQSGGASCANKLLTWLKNWQNNQGVPKDQRPKPKWTGKGMDDPTGASFRAALLSGPPGIGKTTTAILVAKECGMETIEFNASDARNKKTLQSVVKSSANDFSIVSALKENRLKKAQKVVIMDEVDGMSGNADRGGMQELIQIIKEAHVPIICLCNDRQHQKIRSLANHCFDLRFPKPRIEQITGAMMSICFREGFKIAPPAVKEIIASCNQDIRQTIHTLSMMAAKNSDGKKIEYEDAKPMAESVKKDLHHGPFDVLRMIFSSDRSKPSPDVIGKQELFFQDYSLMPKFVFENYTSIRPFNNTDNRSHLRKLARSADALSLSNLVETNIMKKQQWGLLPAQATLSTVIPATLLAGSMNKMINFPSELGKMSSTNKMARLADELKFHTKLTTKADRIGIVLEGAPSFRNNLVEPLVRQSNGKLEGSEGVDQTLSFLREYALTKEDMDSIFELTQWPGMTDPLKNVNSKVKAALTRAYNKSSEKAVGSYAISQTKGKSKKKKTTEEDEDGEESAHDSDDDLSAFKAKKKPAKAKSTKKKK